MSLGRGRSSAAGARASVDAVRATRDEGASVMRAETRERERGRALAVGLAVFRATTMRVVGANARAMMRPDGARARERERAVAATQLHELLTDSVLGEGCYCIG